MSKYNPFEKARRKLQKTFEKSEFNINEHRNIKRIEKSFRSENHYKPVTIINIATAEPILLPGQRIISNLNNFPEWAVNMSSPSIVLSFDSAYKPSQAVDDFSIEFANGTLKNGDITLIRWEIYSWFTKRDNGYDFTVKFDINPRVATGVSDFGFGSSALPTVADINLYVLNERNYNEIQSGK